MGSLKGWLILPRFISRKERLVWERPKRVTDLTNDVFSAPWRVSNYQIIFTVTVDLYDLQSKAIFCKDLLIPYIFSLRNRRSLSTTNCCSNKSSHCVFPSHIAGGSHLPSPLLDFISYALTFPMFDHRAALKHGFRVTPAKKLCASLSTIYIPYQSSSEILPSKCVILPAPGVLDKLVTTERTCIYWIEVRKKANKWSR